jgi:hypothetical protein
MGNAEAYLLDRAKSVRLRQAAFAKYRRRLGENSLRKADFDGWFESLKNYAARRGDDPACYFGH